nr:reverse transcriptase zinc-binding domain-containing protein [Tanacetum cinerariifolium]
MRGFLRCQGEMKNGKAKVVWETICFPKNEGGLGIRRRSFWDVPSKAGMNRGGVSCFKFVKRVLLLRYNLYRVRGRLEAS